MADVVLSAKMSDSELLKSIETTLNKSEAKFNSFADNANKKLNSIGAGLGNSIASNLNAQLNSVEQRLNAISTKTANMTTGNSNITLNVNDFQAASTHAKEMAQALKESAKESKKLNTNLQRSDLVDAKNQTAQRRILLELERQNLLLQRQAQLRADLAGVAQRAAQAEARNRIAIGGSSYDNAMKMNSASIQDRIEKIKALQTVQRNLSNTDVDYNSKLASVNRSISALNNENKKAISSGVELEKRTNKLADSFNNLTRRVIYYTALGFFTSFVKDLVGVRAEYEMLERSFGVLLDSFQNGSKVFAEIQANALKSPFSVIELTSAAKQLIAYNFTQKEVVDTTKRLGDVSAALGVPMERIVYNLGQIRSQTVLTASDARDFANAGLPMISNLAKLYTEQEGKVVSTGEVYDRMTKKMVTYNDVMKVFNNLTNEGGMFFDYQAKQAETLKGQLSNLKDAYDQMLNSMGKDSQGAIELPIKALRSMFENWKEVTNVLGLVIGAYGALKAKTIIQNALFGAHNAAITKSIMFDKIHKASMLEKKALYETLSTAELRAIATKRTATVTDYQQIISTQGITKAQAIRLIAMNQSNVALKAAIVNEKILTVAQANSATKAMALGLSFKNLGLSIKAMGTQFALTSMALLTNPFTYIILGLVAAGAAIVDYTNRMAEIKKFNNDLVDSTKESIDDINTYIKENQPSIKLTMTKTGMNEEESIKFWESLRSEIEKTTTASDYFMQRLLPVSDINERNRQAIELLETIRNTGNIMANFSDNEITLNQDIMWGLGGEGLITDLKDASDYLKDYAYNTGIVQGALKESSKEVGVFADNLKKVFDKNNIKDEAVVVALRRVMDTLEKDNDKLKGDVKDFFEIELEKQFGLTNTLWQKYVDGLAQYGVNSVKDYENMSESAQKDVREKGLADFKKRMPQYYDTMEELVHNINNNLVMHIRVKFNEGEITNFQKEFDKRIQGRSPEALDVYRPTSQENLTNWTKAQQDAIKSVDEQIKNYQADLKSGEGKQRGWAKKQIEELEIEKAKRKTVLTIFNQSYESEKNLNKERRKGEGELSKTIKSEIDLINKLTSNYDKLTKAGMTGRGAIAMLGKEYGNTLKSINSELSKYGLKTFSIENFAGKDVSKVLDLLKVQRDALPQNGKIDVKKALDVEIEKIVVDAKVVDLNKLNKELEDSITGIKESFEIGIEFKETPDLASIFKDMFMIDESDIITNVDDVINKLQERWNKYVEDYNKLNKESKIKQTEIIVTKPTTFIKENNVDPTGEVAKNYKMFYDAIYGYAKNDAEKTLKEYNDLNYKLTDNSGKIIIEERKLEDLRVKLAKETNEKRKSLLNLQIIDQQNTIDKIKEENLQLLPFYQKLFGDTYNLSSKTLQKIADDAKSITDTAKEVTENGVTKIELSLADEGGNIKKTVVSLEQYRKILKAIEDINQKNIEKNPFKKIADDIKKSNTTELLNDLSGELKKTSEGIALIGSIFKDLGGSDDAVEVINDVAQTIDGLSTAAQGAAQIAAGDIIGGTVNIIKGTWTAISGWLDNSNKKIDRKIKDSEFTVKKLANAYTQLEYAANKALGSAEIKAQRLLVANKKAQLEEAKRQLALEESRKKKNRDRDKEEDLKAEIANLKNDINDLADNVANTLLNGDIKSAAESFASTWIEAWREGNDTIANMNSSFEDMIDNMIVKSLASTLVANRLKNLYSMVDEFTQDKSEGGEALVRNEILKIQEATKGLAEGINADLTTLVQSLGIGKGSSKTSSTLSSLQQGIQGLSEQTGGAIEGYMNNVSQQSFAQTSLLQQLAGNSNVSLGTQSQMLLQLQQGYQVLLAMQSMLQGWSSNSGRSVRVEMIN